MDKIITKLLNLKDTNFQIDSRLIKKDDVFFCLKGEKTDGHLYLKDIGKKGAKIAIVSKDYVLNNFSQTTDLEIIKVKNTLTFLQEFASESLKKTNAKKIGITGSFGKTTTLNFLYSLLNGLYKVSKTYKNYNSQIGLPISVLNMDKRQDFILLEMAMDEKNEIKKLVDIAPIDIGVILSLTPYHQNFESIENVAKAKKEIFLSKNIKFKLINQKLSNLKAFQDDKYLTYSSENKNANFYLEVDQKNLKGFFFENGRFIKDFPLPFKESHFLENLSACLAILRILKVDIENIEEKFKDLKPYPLRHEKVLINGTLFIKDCYNANPIPTIISLQNLSTYEGEKIAVLGENVSLGKSAKKAHLEILKEAKKSASHILLIGDIWKSLEKDILKDSIKHFSTIEEMAIHLKKIIKTKTTVLVKGSRFFEMEKIFDFIN